jgi:hypothetical protein
MKIEMTGDALNKAAWLLHDRISQYQEINAPLFNNIKGCLKDAIELFLTEKLEEKDNGSEN